MNPISHLLAGAAISLVLVVAGCDKPAGTSAGRDPDRGGVAPAAGTVESRPLPVRAVRAEGEALFEALPAGRTGIDYGMHWDDPASVLKEFIFLNPSGGICAGDYDGDGLPDLYITSPSGGNRLYRNTGGFKFEDVTKASGVSDPGFWGTGASFVDIDDDGDLDDYRPPVDESDDFNEHMDDDDELSHPRVFHLSKEAANRRKTIKAKNQR